MTTDVLRYDRMVEDALRGVVREALTKSVNGLPGGHYFYISFRTDYPGVVLSKPMRAKYPEEITIVLQHQYWDLTVRQDWFEVTLSFNQVSEQLHVPFAALTAFADPSVKMALQFSIDEEGQEDNALAPAPEGEAGDESGASDESQASDKPGAPKDGGNAEVIALDAFRKK